MLDRKQILDLIEEKMLAQGKKSKSSDFCRYRMKDENTGEILKCAIGHLIDDEDYERYFEDNIVSQIFTTPEIKKSFQKFGDANDKDINWLDHIQEALHDRIDDDNFVEEFKRNIAILRKYTT